MQLTTTAPFSQIVDAAIDDARLSKEAVAIEAGMHRATLYRVLGGKPVSKPKALALISAVNRLAMFQVIDPALGLRSAGYDGGHAQEINERLIASIVDNLTHLPLTVQEDLLEQIRALRRKYEKL